jgi:thiamine monophosphate synthase
MLAAGARRFVVVRWLTDADDPRAAARTLRRLIDDASDYGASDSPGSS